MLAGSQGSLLGPLLQAQHSPRRCVPPSGLQCSRAKRAGDSLDIVCAEAAVLQSKARASDNLGHCHHSLAQSPDRPLTPPTHAPTQAHPRTSGVARHAAVGAAAAAEPLGLPPHLHAAQMHCHWASVLAGWGLG